MVTQIEFPAIHEAIKWIGSSLMETYAVAYTKTCAHVSYEQNVHKENALTHTKGSDIYTLQALNDTVFKTDIINSWSGGR